MSYYRKTVIGTGNEKEFIHSLISSLTSADERITLLTDMDVLDAAFENENAVPQFQISFGNFFTLTFRREYRSGETAKSYILKMGASGSENTIFISSGYNTLSANALRTMKLQVISNDTVMLVRVGAFNSDLDNTSDNAAVFEALGFCSGSVYGTANGLRSSAAVLSRVFVMSDESSSQVVKSDRLLYTYSESEPYHLEIIRSKVFCTRQTAIRKYVSAGLFDCTAVVKNIVLSINGKSYYTIDEHTLMEV